jgi:hypothetical protein
MSPCERFRSSLSFLSLVPIIMGTFLHKVIKWSTKISIKIQLEYPLNSARFVPVTPEAPPSSE